MTLEERIHQLERKVAQLEQTKPAGKSRLTSNWEIRDADHEWAAKYEEIIDVESETEKFKDYWISKGERRANWYAGWRNWIRKAVEFAATQPRGQRAGSARPEGRTAFITEINRERAKRAADKFSALRGRTTGNGIPAGSLRRIGQGPTSG